MAMVNPKITVEVINVDGFRELGERYQVTVIPKTVINDTISFEGAAPEEFLVGKVMSLNR
jgi:hypothetical protein